MSYFIMLFKSKLDLQKRLAVLETKHTTLLSINDIINFRTDIKRQYKLMIS